MSSAVRYANISTSGGSGTDSNPMETSYSNPTAYETFMGRWSARLAPSFLRFAGVKGGERVLDVGCGTGTLSRAANSLGLKARIAGIDPVSAYVSFARQAAPNDLAEFRVGRAESLPFADKTFDAAVSLLALQDFTDSRRAVHEMARVTRTGGRLAACVWDFRDGLPMLAMFWQAAETVAPEIVSEQRRQNPSRPHATLADLESLWRDGELSHIETTTLTIAMNFTSFDDYWQPFLGASTPTSAFAAMLNRDTHGALAQALRDRLPGVRPDGSFVLPARAWAVKGAAISAAHGH
jgi:ubiquinone/menaquinone biosynthesis C-methylase UbiE